MAGGHQIIDVRLEPDHAGWRLDRALAAAVPTMSRERLKALIRNGALEPAVRDPATKVKGTEAFKLAVPEPEPAHNEPQDIPLTIVFEDEHLLVIDKAAGLVVPKTDVAHEGLARQFARHSIDRRYLAIVAGVPRTAAGTVDAPLARSSANRKKIAVVKDGRGKRAVTHWRRLEMLRDAALVECRLETGRTHQVRVHMASIGHPLLGDSVYGGVGKTHRKLLQELGFHRQALHAAGLGFIHPVTRNRLSFESGMPTDMQELFSALGV